MHSEPKISSSEKNSFLKRVRDWVVKKWGVRDWDKVFTVIPFGILFVLVIILVITIYFIDAPSNKEVMCHVLLRNLGIANDKNCDIGLAIERLGFAIGGIIALLVALASFQRAKALDKTAEAQNKTAKAENKIAEAEVQGSIEDRYKNAISQFGNETPSVRLAGAYGLYHLAIDNKDRRRNICDVLCVHIRDLTTGEAAVGKTIAGKEIIYSKKYETQPSNEVQSILDLLTKKDKEKDPLFKSEWINLENAYLKGANLQKAQLQGATLIKTQLQGATLKEAQVKKAILFKAQFQEANLRKAQLQEADLRKAQLQGANLREAQLQEANLRKAQLQGAKLNKAQLQGANLKNTNLENAELQNANFTGTENLTVKQLEKAKNSNLSGVYLAGLDLSKGNFSNFKLNNAQFQGATLNEALFQGAELNSAQFQEADLKKAQFQGAKLNNAQFQGADLEEAQFQEAKLNSAQLQGATLNFAKLQGADLKKAQLQAANLNFAELQRADLREAQLQAASLSFAQFQEVILEESNFSGAFTEKDISISDATVIDSAIDRLKDRSGKKADLEDSLFSGGVPAGAEMGVYPKKDAYEVIKILREVKKKLKRS